MIRTGLLRIIICIAVAGLCQTKAFAQTVQERLISSTFKTLAKTYISAADFSALKKNTLARLEPLDNDSFHEKYPRALKLIDDAPALRKQFGLHSDMSVEQAIVFIRSLDKKKVFNVIDAIPDQAVARHVAQDFSSATQSVNSKNVADQVAAVWRDLQDRLDRTIHPTPQ
jgi:hypothetical protein